MERNRKRCVYITARQKKKLVELITKNPELISCKVKPGFSYKDSQKLWQNIATECNALPGARKTWKQWRKTWQDLKSKTKKRNTDHDHRDLPTVTLTPAEQEVLGIKNSPRKSESPQPPPEFVQLDQDMTQDHNYGNDLDFTGSMSEPESPPEPKVFTSVRRTRVKNNKVKNSQHSDCYINCDALTSMEKRKLKVKEDYLKFKKDYLRQKLKLIKEQTEALKSIARELSK